MWLLCSVIDINRIFIFFLNEITEGERLDGGNLLSLAAGVGEEVSSAGGGGLALEVHLDTGLGGLDLGGLVLDLAAEDLLLALGLANVLDADVDAFLEDAAVHELVHADSDGRLGDVEDDAGAAVVVLVGHALVNGGIGEDVDVVSHMDGHEVLGEMDGSLLAELLSEHVARTRAGSE